jgi:putative ATPase
MELFSKESDSQPLAARMRPETLEDLVGQDEILGPGRLLRRAIKSDQLSSIIFYGPPGTGKTTLARIIANTTKSHFISLNAVLSGIKQVKEAIEKAQDLQRFQGKKTLLFVDEVHRWNKAQQDALLPWVENGTIILIGATTENPFFEVNSALVSRSRIFQMKPLTEDNLREIALKALTDKNRGYGKWSVQFEVGALDHLVKISDGDARTLLNAIQLAVETTPEVFPPPTGTVIYIDSNTAEESIQKRAVLYDRDGDYHFDTISAFIKSLRGSDPDAALYWLAVMVRAGEDPSFIFRRMLISAAEDIGLADPQALVVVTAASQAFERTGFPEGNFFLTQAALYLATAPKSNSSLGFFDALKAVEQEGGTPVPVHLRDASRDAPLGHGAGYQYPHSFRYHWVSQQYLPSALRKRIFYHPGPEGYENGIRDHVLSRRECQLTAVLTDTDEELTYGPDNEERDKWVRRTENGVPEFLKGIRDRLFSVVSVKRNYRILILEETTGFLSLEACRKAPEGGVFTVMQKGSAPEVMESMISGWPESEKPLQLKNPAGPYLIEELKRDNFCFDLVTGIIQDPDKTETITEILSTFLSEKGHFSFLFHMPGMGTKPVDLLPQGTLNEQQRVLYQRWEERSYSKAMASASRIKDCITDNQQLSLLEGEELSRTEEYRLTERRISGWMPEKPETSPFWDFLAANEIPCYQEIRDCFLSLLAGKTVNREKKFLFLHGIMSNK